MNKVFRMPKLHRNSDGMGKIIKDLNKYGYFHYNGQRVKLVQEECKIDLPYVTLAYVPL